MAPLNWGPPNGYPDVAGAWTSAHGMLEAWNSHRAIVQGWHKGLTYPKPEQLLAARPATAGAYLDALAERLLFQPVTAEQRQALLTFLKAGEGTRLRDASSAQHVAPLLLDSIYHALR
jgi:hypothetical protein